jgi:hypothetical protein
MEYITLFRNTEKTILSNGLIEIEIMMFGMVGKSPHLNQKIEKGHIGKMIILCLLYGD